MLIQPAAYPAQDNNEIRVMFGETGSLVKVMTHDEAVGVAHQMDLC